MFDLTFAVTHRSGRSFPGTGRRAQEGEVGVKAIGIQSPIFPGRSVKLHRFARRRTPTGDPSFLPQIIQGIFHVDQTASNAPGQVLDLHMDARIAEAEGKHIHMNRTTDQNREQFFRR